MMLTMKKLRKWLTHILPFWCWAAELSSPIYLKILMDSTLIQPNYQRTMFGIFCCQLMEEEENKAKFVSRSSSFQRCFSTAMSCDCWTKFFSFISGEMFFATLEMSTIAACAHFLQPLEGASWCKMWVVLPFNTVSMLCENWLSTSEWSSHRFKK